MDFDAVVERYEKPVFNLIYRLVGDWDEAADLTQETFIAAYRSLDEFRGEASVYTWLYRIAVNKCRNAFKKRDRQRLYVAPEAPSDEELESVPNPGKMGEPAAELERKEVRALVEKAISELPLDYRIVAVLRDLHGLAYSQISDATGLSIDVVKMRIARARAMLRRKLAPFLVE